MSVAEVTAIDRISSNRDDEPLFEVINGEIVELPPMSFHSTKLATRLVGEIFAFLKINPLGEVASETLFRLPLEEDFHRNRRPDAAFVSYQRWPRGKPEAYSDNAWDVVPDLAIEVVSPSDPLEDLMDKLGEYFEVDVRTVWVVHPRQKLVQVYESMVVMRAFRIDDTLDGGQVLPGFRLPLKEIFVSQMIDDREQSSDE